MKKMLIAGNWKMNTDATEALALTKRIVAGVQDRQFISEILVCPPFVNLQLVCELVKSSNIKLGSQNCSEYDSGAFTGEISIRMLQSYDCEYIIIGHSERRQFFGENDLTSNKKILNILDKQLKVIYCIGEKLEHRKSGQTFQILEKQLLDGLKGVESEKSAYLNIAYEPVWAIGTGVSAEPEQVQDAHAFIRQTLFDLFGKSAKDIIIQYGGSVNDKNAESILSLDDVNGALIGGASLDSEQFISIISTAEKIIGR